ARTASSQHADPRCARGSVRARARPVWCPGRFFARDRGGSVVSAEPAAERERVLIRCARDVTDLVNSGAARGSHARMIVLLALGGIFLDAYDLTSLAYGITDIREEFGLSSSWAGA